MHKAKILIIEDEPDIAEMIAYNLKKESYRPISISNGEAAVPYVKKEKPDLIILDLMLPGIDGLDVCRSLREKEATAHIPIIMLTAKSQETDKIIGLELGADDYMTKPFSPRELTARIKAVLRRSKRSLSSRRLSAGGITVDAIKHQVTVFGKPAALTSTEFKLLEFMIQHPGSVLSRDKILDNVFGYDSSAYDRTVDAHIKSLRKKLGRARDYIETVRGVGYKFREL